MKRLVPLLLASLLTAAFLPSTALAVPPNLTGSWVIQQSGLNGTSESRITLTQSGNGFVGQNPTTGTGFTGTFVDDSKINGTWKGPGGAGWLTIYASPNGHSFNGTWGYNGRPANGSFTGNKFLPPSPITAAGRWNVVAAGGNGAIAGPMTCTQSGRAAICHMHGAVVINGAFKTNDKIRAKWTDGKQSGWFSFWFNGDNNSFNGVWGIGPDTTPAAGRVVGQRALGGA